MNNAVKNEVPAEKPVLIVDVQEQAQVIAAGIVNRQNKATAEQMERYCSLVIAGKPTGKVFPNKLSEMEFTDEQRESLRGARAEHKLNCMNSKKTILAIVRSKNIETIGHKTNKAGTAHTIRAVDRSIVTESLIYGPNKKA